MIQRMKIHGDIFPIPDDKAMAPVEATHTDRQAAGALMASILSKTKV